MNPFRAFTAAIFALAGVIAAASAADQVRSARAADERLSFQTSGPWSPRTNLNADVAMVYGIGPDLPAKIETWRQHGYIIHVMTGVAWGNYQDYLYGRYDGQNHWDQAQKDRNGNIIGHGVDIPYISPGENYGKYLTVGVKRALDAGAEAIYLEEPEFWARSGWEDNFKREWKAYYHEDWMPPDSSPDAQYRTSKLKYYLYRRALAQVFDFAKEYGKSHHRTIRCYVPTHSLINYAHWGIVSPESSLTDVGGDGFIAQVWTGTARTPNVYEGRKQERTFETAFLEYGAMQNLVRASKTRVWYLNDPIEDNPNHDWGDYRRNWENTLTASLLQPEVWRYEIMPWPDRIFNGKYPAEPGAGVGPASQRERGDNRVPIPQSYATELQSVIRALGEMKQPADKVKWLQAGTQGVGVLVSDTMMFQRGAPRSSDENLGSFYGLAMPLLKLGMPVEPVQIEAAGKPGFLRRYKMLLLTYEGQKPPTAAFHTALAKWVREGGALVVVDDDHDPYLAARDWWNAAPLKYRTPREHLFAQLGLESGATGAHRVGHGMVVYSALSPAALTYRPDGADTVRLLARSAADAVKLPWIQSGAIVLRRGPYIVASGLDELKKGITSSPLRGRFIDLFGSDLPIVNTVEIAAGRRLLLYDLDAVQSDTPKVVAAACRVDDERSTPTTLRFNASGIADTRAVVRIVARSKPTQVRVGGKAIDPAQIDFADGCLRLSFQNSVDKMPIEVRF